MILIYTTTKDKSEAKKIARHLLEKKLIACATFHETDSLYLWEGKIVGDEEFVLFLKTVEEKYDDVVATVTQIHSYTVPCILKIPIEASDAYGKWVDTQLSEPKI